MMNIDLYKITKIVRAKKKKKIDWPRGVVA